MPLGAQVELLPLLEISALAPDSSAQAQLQQRLQQLQQPNRYALVAFVSPNAIAHCFAAMAALGLQWPTTTAIAVMGAGSRSTLQDYPTNGAAIFAPLDINRSDSETLLQVLDLDQLRGKEVLIVRGQSGREFLADALQAHGVQVTQVAAYQRQLPKLTLDLRQRLRHLLRGDCWWLISSSEALRGLMKNAA